MQCEDIPEKSIDYLAGGLDETERQDLERHLETCCACRAELSALSQTWRELGEIQAMRPNTQAMRMRFEAMLTEQPVKRSVVKNICGAWQTSLPPIVTRRLALGSVIAVLAFCVWFYGASNVSARSKHYQTGISEHLAVALADGSQVELNARSTLSATVNASVRELRLDDGEALFRVAKGPIHPFLVQTPEATIEAKGTQFNVDVSTNTTVITLLEGHVLVTSPASPPLLLNPGEQLSVGFHDHVPSKPHMVDVKAVIAWTEHRLVFEDTPLSMAVSKFNRYSPQPFVIQDPSLETLAITASLDTGSSQFFADALSANDVLKVTRQASGPYLISRK